MRAITLTQPWATLVALGAKRIETRSWATSYRGPLAIHAAKGLGPVGGMRGMWDQCAYPAFFRALEPHFRVMHLDLPSHGLIDCIQADELPRGAVVAIVDLVDCIQISNQEQFIQRNNSRWLIPPGAMTQEYAFGDYAPGRYAWLLDDVQPLPEPIPAKGQLGLWKWKES